MSDTSVSPGSFAVTHFRYCGRRLHRHLEREGWPEELQGQVGLGHQDLMVFGTQTPES